MIMFKKTLFASFLLFVSSTVAIAHPWGGLVIDKEGNIYFTFICPFVDDDHLACVWKIDSELELSEALTAQRSPSDIILARTPERLIYGAERSGQNPNYQNRLWSIKNPLNTLILESSTTAGDFIIQAYTVSNDGAVYYANGGDIYILNPDGESMQLGLNQKFNRIQLLKFGPDESLYILADDNLYFLKNETAVLVASDLKEESPENIPFRGANIFFDMVITDTREIYLAYYGDRKVIKVDLSGNIETVLEAKAPWAPHGIDYFDGELYVLESTLGDGRWWEFWKTSDDEIIPRVRKINRSGEISEIFSYSKD
jgi:hypothetical protein